MSLDQLPDELITYIGFFMDYKYNRQFGLSQKRIHNILKRDRLDKPQWYQLRLDDHTSDYYLVYRNFAESKKFGLALPIKPLEIRDVDTTFFAKILRQFRSLDNVEIRKSIPAIFMENLLETKADLRSVTFKNAKMCNADPEFLVAFCKRFKPNIDNVKLHPAVFNDEVFIQILPYAQLNVKCSANPHNIDTHLTNRVLRALVEPQVVPNFSAHVDTHFTINGIKDLTQQLIAKETWNVGYYLGVLRSEEKEQASVWIVEVNAMRNAPLSIEVEDTDDCYAYFIQFQKCEQEFHSAITFDVKKA